MKWIIALALSVTPALAQQANSVYIDQVGNNNTIYIDQNGGANKRITVLNSGDYNSIAVSQQDSGNQQAFIGTVPSSMNANGSINWNKNNNNSNNNFAINQSGTGNHTAAINLDPNTASSNDAATITQGGSGNKTFSLNLSGSSISATVIQDNPMQANTGSMSIACVTPPCSGYSYIRH